MGVDFSASPIDSQAFCKVLSYLATDDLHVPSNREVLEERSETAFHHALLCILVASLADQYQLKRLQRLAESFVIEIVLPAHANLVLPILEKSWEKNAAIESACWQKIDRDANTIFCDVDV